MRAIVGDLAGLLRVGSSMVHGIRSYWRLAAGVLRARSPQEREKRTAHAFGLLLVCAVAILKGVTGLTVDRAPFTLFLPAVAASAARGGVAPALVATLASILVAGLVGPPPGASHARLLFLVEGLLTALIVSAVRSSLHRAEARLESAQATIAELKLRDRHGRLLGAALRHLEDTARETAVIVLDTGGTIIEWRTSAERLYGYPAEDVVGASAASLFFDALSPGDLTTLLHESVETGSLRRSGVHRRRDGGRIYVELQIEPIRDVDVLGFTLTAHDIAKRREWDDYRDAARRAQATLQQAADDTRRQLAALVSLTDPSLNPLEGPEIVAELLERLRATVNADGAALTHSGRADGGVIAARGLQPIAGPIRAEMAQLTPGRVAVVHNDSARVVQLSALRWAAGVTSLLAVPVVHDGRVWSTIEVVSERSRHVTDWDVALVRIVADRLAAVVVEGRQRAAKAS